MLYGIILMFILVGIDQASKQLAFHFLANPTASKTVIPYVLEFSYHENTGASLGILDGQMILFMVITVFALMIFGALYVSSDFRTKRVYSYAIVLFIAGTIGNAIDRALLGYVIDFMHFPFLSYILNPIGISNFYNNMADMYLSVAIVLFFIDLFFIDPKRKKLQTHDENVHTE